MGRPQLEHFYGRYFIPGMPADVELVPISRTVGYERIVDEFVFRVHAHGPDGLAATRCAADRATTGVGYGGGRSVRRWEDPPRAHPLGPGFSSRTARLAKPGESACGWVRDSAKDARPWVRTVESPDEADDHRRFAVTQKPVSIEIDRPAIANYRSAEQK